MVGVLWCGCSLVSCTVMMSMLWVFIVCSSSVCFLCRPFMLICRMFSLFLFWWWEGGWWVVVVVVVVGC